MTVVGELTSKAGDGPNDSKISHQEFGDIHDTLSYDIPQRHVHLRLTFYVASPSVLSRDDNLNICSYLLLPFA